MGAGHLTCLYFLYLCRMEVKGNNRTLYKAVLGTLRIIPMLLAFVCLMNTTLSYFGIDAPVLSYIGGVSVLPLVFLYLSSYAFRFCSYHRMFLHYVLLNWILNIVDYYIGIPVSDKNLFLMYLIVTCIFLFIILYLKMRCRNGCGNG